MRAVDEDPRNEMAWVWLTGLVDDLEDKIIACENALTVNPANEKVRAYLESLLKQRESVKSAKNNEVMTVSQILAPIQERAKKPDLLSLAEQLEQEGKLEEALKTYEMLAAKTRDSRKFDHIYRQIIRLEGLQQENIRHISPSLSLWRMTFTWSLLYLSFVFVQVGLNPFAHLSLLWLGIPFVTLGSFLLALSEVRTRHVIWERIFLEQGSGSGFARMVLAVAGWLLIIIPFALIVFNSLARLQNFQIPPEPFFR